MNYQDSANVHLSDRDLLITQASSVLEAMLGVREEVDLLYQPYSTMTRPLTALFSLISPEPSTTCMLPTK